jgi:tryptophanyl-tRNA synthetase
MSKSRPEGCLFLDDSPQVIREKIKKAVTDSGHEIKYDLKNKPAISNLMKIYQAMSEISLKNIEKRYRDKGYGDFKKDLAEIIIACLSPFQERKKRLSKRPQKVGKILKTGAKKAGVVAEETMKEIKKKVGLI